MSNILSNIAQWVTEKKSLLRYWQTISVLTTYWDVIIQTKFVFSATSLIYFPLVPHISIDKLGQYCFRKWLGTYSVPSYYLNLIVNWTLRNKFQWNFNQNSNIFIQENVFENVEGDELWSGPFSIHYHPMREDVIYVATSLLIGLIDWDPAKL